MMSFLLTQKLSYGEYLAGDEGVTFELSRSFLNGTKFGAFASFTDVSSEQFGEGAFDKGIFFSIPVYGNFHKLLLETSNKRSRRKIK